MCYGAAVIFLISDAFLFHKLLLLLFTQSLLGVNS